MATNPHNAPAMVPMPLHKKWMTLEPWSFSVNGDSFTIPIRYMTDGASVPRLFHRVITPYNPGVMIAALEHDFLCELKPKNVRYDAAARHFRDRLKIDKFRKELMYKAVLYFGPKW